jgi:predicted transcriptional regulator
MKENYRDLMKNDKEESPTTLSNESIRKMMDILEPEIKCSLLFLEEKGVSLEEMENLRKDVINFVHERVSKMHCDEEYKTRIIITAYQKLLYTTYSIARSCG